jgi:hypothetical protein
MKFKLQDQSALEVSDHVQFYARALRVIGQDLQALFPQGLEITAEAMNFEVTGRYVPRDAAEKAKQGSAREISQEGSGRLIGERINGEPSMPGCFQPPLHARGHRSIG